MARKKAPIDNATDLYLYMASVRDYLYVLDHMPEYTGNRESLKYMQKQTAKYFKYFKEKSLSFK